MNRLHSANQDDNSRLERRNYEKSTNQPIKYISPHRSPKNCSAGNPILKKECRAYTAEPKKYRTYYVPVVTKQYVSADAMLNVRNGFNAPYLYQSGYEVPHKETLPAPAGDISNHQWMYLKHPKTVTKNHAKQYLSNAGDYIREDQYYAFNKYPQIDSSNVTYFLPDKEPLYVNPAVNYNRSNNSTTYYQDCRSLNYTAKSADLNCRSKNAVYYPMYVPASSAMKESRKYSDYSTATSCEKEYHQTINPDAKRTKILFTNPKHKSIEAMVDVVTENSDTSTVYNITNSDQQVFSINPSKPEMVSTETATQTCDISYLKSLLGIKTSSASLTDQATQTVLNKNEKEKKQSRCSSRQTQTAHPAAEDIQSQRHVNIKTPKNLKESVDKRKPDNIFLGYVKQPSASIQSTIFTESPSDDENIEEIYRAPRYKPKKKHKSKTKQQSP